MKLSTRGRYGVRLMLDLAEHYGNGPIYLKDIAQRQEISEKYLWQLVPPLKSAGLITTVRGAKGGYYLSKSPKDINLMDIIKILEGPLFLVDCVDNPAVCERAHTCITREVWEEVSQKIGEILMSITLESLVERQRSKTQDAAYYI
ncbi:MAG: Rrf2 family transcriptional regulator [Deltaproteobacteria bacterium]